VDETQALRANQNLSVQITVLGGAKALVCYLNLQVYNSLMGGQDHAKFSL